MARGNAGFKVKGADTIARRRAVQRAQAFGDERAIPGRSILIAKQAHRAIAAKTGGKARSMQLHQGQQRPRSRRSGRGMFGNESRQANRFQGDVLSDQGVARRRGVAFVEHQVERIEHRIEALGQLGGRRRSEVNTLLSKRPLGPHQSLRNRRLLRQKRAGNFAEAEAANQLQREGDARFRRHGRMAGEKQQADLIVFDRRRLVAKRHGWRGEGQRRRRGIDGFLHDALVPQPVERAVSSDAVEPGLWSLWNTAIRPMLKRRHERVLHRILDDRQMARPETPGERRDHLPRLPPEQMIDECWNVFHCRWPA